MARDLIYWRTLALEATQGVTATQLDQIAEICAAAEKAGKQVGIWHAASTVFGTLGRCPCLPCSKARGEP